MLFRKSVELLVPGELNFKKGVDLAHNMTIDRQKLIKTDRFVAEWLRGHALISCRDEELRDHVG